MAKASLDITLLLYLAAVVHSAPQRHLTKTLGEILQFLVWNFFRKWRGGSKYREFDLKKLLKLRKKYLNFPITVPLLLSKLRRKNIFVFNA